MLFAGKPYPEIISLHIPKTAGTSFRNILKSVYGDDAVVRFDINNRNDIRLNEITYNKQTLPKVRVIHGHFEYALLSELFKLPENYKIITWMRDPVKRVISNYYYLESRLKDIVKEENRNVNILSKLQRSLIEYARADINRNRQSKFLNGRSLETFDFVGIHENFNEEINRLSGILNWKTTPDILFHNRTSEKKSEIDQNIINEIASLNADDISLYNKAKRIRTDKLSGE